MKVQINSPEIEAVVCLTTPCGGETASLPDDAAVAAFRADPDKWAAAYFSLSLAEYGEWIELQGHPLCGARTKRGTLCRMFVGGQLSDAAEWKQRHRNYYCKLHGGNQ